MYYGRTPGGGIELNVGGFAKHEGVRVWLGSKVGDQSRGEPQAVVLADEKGEAHFTFPPGTKPGQHFYVEGRDFHDPSTVKRVSVPCDRLRQQTAVKRWITELRGAEPTPDQMAHAEVAMARDLTPPQSALSAENARLQAKINLHAAKAKALREKLRQKQTALAVKVGVPAFVAGGGFGWLLSAIL